MKQIRFLILTLIIVCCSSSCGDLLNADSDRTQNLDNNNNSGQIILGQKLDNPYSLANMQKALNSILATKGGGDEITLEPTDYYVRIQPKDTAEYRALMDLDLDLFFYPLDYEILQNGECYQDPGLPDDAFPWVYTVAAPELFSEKVQYEVIEANNHEIIQEVSLGPERCLKAQLLEECYIPDHDELLTKSSAMHSLPVSAEELERTAILMSNLPDSYKPIEDTKGLFGSSFTPNGYLYVEKYSGSTSSSSTSTTSYLPISGVRVRAAHIVKVRYAYTDKYGKFTIDGKFTANPDMSVVFRNENGPIIWGKYAFLAPSCEGLKKYDKSKSYSDTIFHDNSEYTWDYAVINNAVSDYYDECKTKGIASPPSSLKIWGWNGSSMSSAPMLRHIHAYRLALGGAAAIIAALGFPGIGIATAVIKALIDIASPDLLIGLLNRTSSYGERYASTTHELHHASHFQKVGESIWGPYIEHCVWNYTTTGDCYGDGLTNDTKQRICELGESWGYANERICAGSTSAGSGEWFDDAIDAVYELMNSGIISKAQLFSCLDSKTKSMDDLFDKIVSKYSSKSYQSALVFANHRVMTNQSTWTIKNTVYGRAIYVEIKKGSFTQTKTVSYGNEYVFGAFKQNTTDISEYRNSSLFPDELKIYIKNSGAVVVLYHESAGTVSCDFARSFGNPSNWEYRTDNTAVGNKNKTINTYVIKATDI